MKLQSIITGMFLCVTLGTYAQQSAAPKTSTKPSDDFLPRAGWTAWSNAKPQDVNKALDDDITTRWSTGTPQTDGQVFGLDMQKSHKIHSITIDQGKSKDDYPKQYIVYVGNDRSNFGKPVAKGKGTKEKTVISFPETKARYIKIVQTGSTSVFWSIHEIYVSGAK